MGWIIAGIVLMLIGSLTPVIFTDVLLIPIEANMTNFGGLFWIGFAMMLTEIILRGRKRNGY